LDYVAICRTNQYIALKPPQWCHI